MVVAAVTGSSGADADAGAVDAAEARTAPVAVETVIGSTQQDVACGRVGPGHHTQEATALAAPSRPGDGLQDVQEAPWAGPPAGQRGLEAEAGPAAEGLAWLQKILGEGSDARLYDLYHMSVLSSREMGFQFLASSDGEQNVPQDLLIG